MRSVPKRLQLPALDSDPLTNELYMTPTELADRWRTSVGVLANRRWKKQPPRFVKLDKSVIYPVSGVLAFERENLVDTSPRRVS